MLVYIINTIIVYIALSISRNCLSIKLKENIDNRSISIEYLFIGIAFISMTLVAGIRYNVGTDYLNYKSMFYNLQNESIFNSNIEPIFILMCRFIYLFSNNSVWMFIITAIFIYYFIFRASIENSKYYEMSIFLFMAFGFYTSTLNIMRQWMACALGFYILVSVRKLSRHNIFILIILAILCHKTSIVLIPAYLFIRKKRNSYTKIILIIISTILYVETNIVIGFINIIVESIPFLSKYNMYLNTNIDEGNSLIFPAFCVIVFTMGKLYENKLKNKEEKKNIYMNILTLAYCTSILGQRFMYFNRIQLFFMPILIILIPQIIDCMKKEDKYLCYAACIILGSIYMVYTISTNGGNPLPYRTIFQII